MPLAQGSLNDHIKSYAGRPAAILDVMRQLCAGVSHMYEQKVLHRDIKPRNVR
jgi:serine/threonine protein kinase